MCTPIALCNAKGDHNILIKKDYLKGAADESRSNVRHPGVSWTIIHEELAEVIGTG
jgi:hypothetical protein